MTNAQLRKAAILIRYLDPATADGLLRQLPPAQANELRQAARALNDVDPIEQQEVLDEFLRHNAPAASMAADDDDGVELAGSLAASEVVYEEPRMPVRAAKARPQSAGDSPFQFLHESEAEELARLLEHEHPQTIALVLAHTGADRASEVLLCFSQRQQAEIVRRLVDLDEANPQALEKVKQNLENRLRTHIEGKKRRATGLATVHQILRAAGPLGEDQLRRSLAAHNDLAELLGEKPRGQRPAPKLQEREYRLFDELAALSDKDLLQVVRQVDHACLQLALADCGVRFAERVLKMLPGKESKALRQALRNLGPLQLRDIEAAQDLVVQAATRLEAAGAIHWPNALVGGVA